MAYMSKEHKAEIAVMLKELLGTNAKKRGFKYTLSVRNLSAIEMNISAGSIDFLGAYKCNRRMNCVADDTQNNYLTTSHADNFKEGHVHDLMEKILKILNHNNYNRSDIMTDYFDVGHYVSVNIGQWDKPYRLEV